MGGHNTGRVDRAQHPAHTRSDVSSLGTVALVTQPVHQLGPGPGDADGVPTGFADRHREAEARQRGRHDVENISRAPTVRPRVSERPEDAEELHQAARVPVGHDQREGVGLGERTCAKWTAWPSMVVMYWGSSLSLASAARQSKPSRQYSASAFR